MFLFKWLLCILTSHPVLSSELMHYPTTPRCPTTLTFIVFICTVKEFSWGFNLVKKLGVAAKLVDPRLLYFLTVFACIYPLLTFLKKQDFEMPKRLFKRANGMLSICLLVKIQNI